MSTTAAPRYPPPLLVLASSSRYRAELLSRLRVEFLSEASAVDETPQPGEHPSALVQRLAVAKARRVAENYSQHWILGSDQSASLDGNALGKPGDIAGAHDQLARCAGREVVFYTAAVLFRGETLLQTLDVTTVRFRALDTDEISRYVAAEPALDCAGSFKCEAYGISLFEAIETRDPTALIGLPLIATAQLLRQAGWTLP